MSASVVGESTVLVIPAALTALTLNEIAGRVWQLADGCTVDELIASLADEVEADPSQIRGDLAGFIDEMLEAGALELIG